MTTTDADAEFESPRVYKRAFDPEDRAVGTRLRMYRRMAGMSQTKLGEALGITFQQVHKYEKGVSRVSAGRLAKIARVLGRRVMDFYADVDTPDAPVSAPTGWIVDLATSSKTMGELCEALAAIRDDHGLVLTLRDLARRIAAERR